MRKSYIFIALAIVTALSMVSCKNNKKTKEPTREEVQEMKQELADSVLAQIDALSDIYIDASDKCFRLRTFDLNDQIRLVKPEYLLDPSVATTLITRSQKLNALAIYTVDYSIRLLYDMPIDDTKEAIARLALDVTNSLNVEDFLGKAPFSEKLKQLYQQCRDNGENTFFWQFQNAILIEISYFVANEPEIVFSRITEDQYVSYRKRIQTLIDAITTLASYDEEMASIVELREKYCILDKNNNDVSLETARNNFEESKELYIARRNALLQ